MSKQTLTIATRESPLAMWQAHYVKHALEQAHPGLAVDLLPMTTRGDKILDSPLAKIGGKGLFIKELEHALLEGRADIAVHSMKDVPMEFPPGLGLGAICVREDFRDAFVSNRYAALDELPEGSVVGSSSLRRQCQLRARRPDLQIRDLRGNVNTRLRKLDEGQYDAIILAAAGLIRLELKERIKQPLAPELCLPAGGQGAVGIEYRLDDHAVAALLAPLNHPETADCVKAERAMNAHLNGGCQVPIAGFALVEKQGQDEGIYLRGLVGEPAGGKILRSEIRGPRAGAESLGKQVAEDLLQQGADSILSALAED